MHIFWYIVQVFMTILCTDNNLLKILSHLPLLGMAISLSNQMINHTMLLQLSRDINNL